MATATANGTGKVTFEPNIPTQVTLRFDGGKQVTSQFDGGTQYLYSCEEGPMYVSPHVAELIEATKAKRGDVLSITKRVRRIGQQQQQHWDVQVITAQATRLKPEDDPREDPFSSQYTGSTRTGEPEQPPPSKRNARYPFPAQTAEEAADAKRRNAESQERIARAEAAATPAAPAPKSHADTLLECLKTAIDVASLAAHYGDRVGFGGIEWTSEDVRAMALSLYIGRTREGGR